MPPDYSSYTREQLLSRIKALEDAMPGVPLHLHPPTLVNPSTKSGVAKLVASSTELALCKAPPIDFHIHARRKIALRFLYAGDEYNGLAHQTLPTPLPTVEGALFAAMAKARLVDPAGGFDACGWERSGRTDRGVSGAGNVVSLWVRSQLKEDPREGAWEPPMASEDEAKLQTSQDVSEVEGVEDEDEDDDLSAFAGLDLDAAPARISIPHAPTQARELRYAHMLNLILPPSIRIIAWSPVASDFSARFSTLRRHYKYFFSPRGMDLERMQVAAAKMAGEHDWRNLCRVDASKQLTSFRRHVLRADISKCSNLDADPDNPGVEGLYVFDLVGSGFLYNQVRHVMAVLFLVGSGLEPPGIVDALLNADASSPNPDTSLPLLERRPEYLMADALPLVLWDCAYKNEDVHWRSDVGADDDKGPGAKSVHFQLSGALERAKIHAALDSCFLAAAARFHIPLDDGLPLASPSDVGRIGFANVLLGGGINARVRRYVPLLERERRESVEEINRKWREGRGKRRKGREDNTPPPAGGDE